LAVTTAGSSWRDGCSVAAELLEHRGERCLPTSIAVRNWYQPQYVWNSGAVHRCYGAQMIWVNGPAGLFSIRRRLGLPRSRKLDSAIVGPGDTRQVFYFNRTGRGGTQSRFRPVVHGDECLFNRRLVWTRIHCPLVIRALERARAAKYGIAVQTVPCPGLSERFH